MCFVGFSIQIELAAVAGFVALFTHCQAVQLSAMTDFAVLNRRTKARIKNCKFFWPEQSKVTFFYAAHMHVSVNS